MAQRAHIKVTRHLWDPNDPDQVDVSKDVYTKLKAKGYRAFGSRRTRMKGEELEEFDGKSGILIMVPPGL